MAEKRYYWLKLKEDFFDEKYIRAMRKLPQGDSLIIVYLKMQLKSLKSEGLLKYEGIMPDCISELAMTIDEDENITRLAVETLVRFGAVERMSNDDLYMITMQNLIGSEGSGAKRVRDFRERQRQKVLQSNENALLCNGEIDIEKEIDIEIEQESEPNGSTPSLVSKNKKPVHHSYGEYKHVKLTDKQYKKLLEDFGEKKINDYITRCDEYCQQYGKNYKDYNLTIRNWIKKDSNNQTDSDNGRKYYDILEALNNGQ